MKTRLIIYIAIFAVISFYSCEKIAFEKKTETDSLTTFNYLWNEVNTKYGFLEYKNIDWDSIYVVYRPMVGSDISDDSLFNIMGSMLNELKDGHVNLFSQFNISKYDITLLGPVNINDRVVKESYLKSDYQITGSFKHNFIHDGKIGYIRYSSFDNSMITDFELDYLVDKYAQTEGLIIDIRQNGGGYLSNVFKLLSIFTFENSKIYETQVKTAPGIDCFSLLEEVTINSEDRKKYSGKVAVLTDRGSYSASSFFSVCTYAYDNIILVGDTTGGGLGLPNGGQLPNGWTYRFSITRTIAVDGGNYENGVPPDFTVILDTDAAETGIDNVIEFAVDRLLE
ncbi:MAG TPA: S41 family peptidase [Bacteroidales bacterium]|nr:S41 family peptidase [Bacteroidales bacterium]